jgi:hypothetical protein
MSGRDRSEVDARAAALPRVASSTAGIRGELGLVHRVAIEAAARSHVLRVVSRMA